MSILGELPKVLKSSIRKRHVPGASVAVLRNGRVVCTAAGMTNLDTQVPATEDTLFQIGSITKIFTTTLIMQLVDERKIELDEPVITYLSEFRVADLDVSRHVTARDLLSHRSGIDGDFFVDSGRGDDSIEKLIEKATMVPNLFPIGHKHSYCNLGFSILGRIAEVVTGKTYDALLRDRIFDPLGMDHSLSLPEDTLRFRCAIGHVPAPRRKNAWVVAQNPYLTFGQKPAGSTPAMSATDLLKFIEMHMKSGRNRKGDKILSARSVKAMQTRQIRMQRHSPLKLTHWGLGWFLMDWQGKKLYGHDGGTVGQSAFLRVLPEKNLAVAMLSNGGDTGGLFQDVFGFVFGGLAGVSEPVAAEPVSEVKTDLNRYAGRYANMNYSLEFRKSRGGLRVRQLANGAEISTAVDAKTAFIDRDTVVLRTGDPVRDRTMFLFSDEQDGRLQFVATGLRQLRRVE